MNAPGTWKGLGELRERLGDVVQAPLLVSGLPGVQYTEPAGDPGLFGPSSICWKVGSDWPSALVGGMSGLILGTLHPLVLAGTLDHSIFRHDPVGRLARTASFVMATAFGATPVAMAAVDHVNRVHRRVSGVAPNGKPYRATEPDLAMWTHVTIYGGFLEGHLRYAPEPVTADQIDVYWQEVARVPQMLGAADAPCSREQVQRYWHKIRPELAVSRDTLDAARWIIEGGRGDTPTVRGAAEALVEAWGAIMASAPASRAGGRIRDALGRRVLPAASRRAVRLAYRILAAAAVDLLPAWGREMLELPRAPLAPWVARTYFGSLRLAVPTVPSALREARQRAGSSAPLGEAKTPP